jgi:hypothetical protein
VGSVNVPGPCQTLSKSADGAARWATKYHLSTSPRSMPVGYRVRYLIQNPKPYSVVSVRSFCASWVSAEGLPVNEESIIFGVPATQAVGGRLTCY